MLRLIEDIFRFSFVILVFIGIGVGFSWLYWAMGVTNQSTRAGFLVITMLLILLGVLNTGDDDE